jgi:hypothetical protein
MRNVSLANRSRQHAVERRSERAAEATGSPPTSIASLPLFTFVADGCRLISGDESAAVQQPQPDETRAMIATIHLSDEHTPQPIPPVNDDDDDDDDEVKPGSGGGNIDPDDDEGEDEDDEDEDETLWTDRDVQWQRMM